MGRKLFKKPVHELSRIETPKVSKDREGNLTAEYDRYQKQSDLDEGQLNDIYDRQDTDFDKLVRKRMLEAKVEGESGNADRASKIGEQIQEMYRLRERYKK
jgi:hypothetical protein